MDGYKTYGGSTYGSYVAYEPYGTPYKKWAIASFLPMPYFTDEQMIAEIGSFVNEWYNVWDYNSQVVPELGTPDFDRFAVKCLGLLPRHISTLPGIKTIRSIKLVKGLPTAAYDTKNNVILLPSQYLNPKHWVEYGLASKLIATSVINGSLIHEMFHAAFTNLGDLENVVDKVNHYDPENGVEYPYGKLLWHIYQILEDIRIEEKAYTSCQSFINAKNVVLLTKQDAEHMAQVYRKEPNVMNGVNLAVFYKRIDLRKTNLFDDLPDEAVKILARCTAYTTSGSKIPSWSERFLECWPPPTREELDAWGMSGKTKESLDQEVDIDLLASEGRIKVNEAFQQEASKWLLKSQEREEFSFSTKYGEEKISLPKPKIVDVEGEWFEDHSRSESEVWDWLDRPIGELGNWKFVRLLNAIRAINNVPGQPLKAGPKLVNTRVSRLVTDGKAFGHYDHEVDKTFRVEIGVLLDLSGSTHQFCWDVDGEPPNDIDEMLVSWRESARENMINLYQFQIIVAYHMANAMKAARIPHFVMAHSSYGNYGCGAGGADDGETPLVVKVVSRNMATTDTRNDKSRFVNLGKLYAENNYDGIAVDSAANLFTERKCRKVLVVLSDGVPEAYHGYHGTAAIQHTKQAIAKLRKKGIDVYYLSLVPMVVELNDQIAGEKYNIDAAKDLEAQFKQLVAEVSRVAR